LSTSGTANEVCCRMCPQRSGHESNVDTSAPGAATVPAPKKLDSSLSNQNTSGAEPEPFLVPEP